MGIYVRKYVSGQLVRSHTYDYWPRKQYEPTTPERPDRGYVFNFNDPMEINSLADVILNEAALDKKYKGGFYDVPLLGDIAQRLVGLGEYTYNSTLKPIFKDGDWGAAGLNLLNNFSETMDIVANPVKGLVLDGPEGFGKGLGLFSDKGRTNYNYDINTGAGGVVDFIANFGAEFLSDPLNWITLGMAGVAKGAAKSVIKEVAEETAETLGKKLAQEGLEAIGKELGSEVAQRFVKEYAEELTEDIVESVGHRLAQEIINPKYVDDVAKLATKNFFGQKLSNEASNFGEALIDAAQVIDKKFALGQVWKTYGTEAAEVFNPVQLTQDVVRITSETINSRMTSSVLNGLRKFISGTDTFEKYLMKGTLYSSGFGFAWYGGKAAIKGAWDAMHVAAKMEDSLNPFMAASNSPLDKLGDIFKTYDDVRMTNASVSKWDADLSATGKTDIVTFFANTERKDIYDIIQTKTDPEDIIKALNEYAVKERKGATFAEYLSKLEASLSELPDDSAKVLSSHINYMQQLWDSTNRLLSARLDDAARVAVKDFHDFVLGAMKELKTNFGKLAPEDFNVWQAGFLQKWGEGLQRMVTKHPIFAERYARVLDQLLQLVKDPKVKSLNEVYGLLRNELGALKSIPTPKAALRRTATDLIDIANIPGTDKKDLIGEAADAAFRKIEAASRELEKARKDLELVYTNTGEVLDLFPASAQKSMTKLFITDAFFDRDMVNASNLPPTIKEWVLDAYDTFIAALESNTDTSLSKYGAAEDFKNTIAAVLRMDDGQLNSSGKHLLGMEPDYAINKSTTIPIGEWITEDRVLNSETHRWEVKPAHLEIKDAVYTSNKQKGVSSLRELFENTLNSRPLIEGVPKTLSLDEIVESVSSHKMLNINADVVGYILKISHVGAAVNLYYSKPLAEAIDLMFNDPTFIANLKRLKESVRGADSWVDEVQLSFEGIRLFKDTLDFIARDPALATLGVKETDALKTAFIDTLMTYSDTPLRDIVNNLELYKAEIKEKITAQINGFQKHKLSIEGQIEENNLRQEFVDYLKQINPDFVKTVKDYDKVASEAAGEARYLDIETPKYHDALVDIEGTRFLAERVLDAPVPAGAHRVYFDFETSGLDVKGGDVLMEVAYRIDGEAPVSFKVKVPREFSPSEMVARKLSGQDTAVDLNKFIEDWNANAFYDSEEEGFIAFMRSMLEAKQKYGRLQFAGQNIEGFDLLFLRNKLAGIGDRSLYTEFNKIIDETPIFDTLRAFQKKYDYFTFEGIPEASSAIDNIFSKYIAQRQLQTMNTVLLPTFAQQADKFLAFRLQHVAKLIRENISYSKSLQEPLENAASDILTKLGNIKNTNNIYRSMLYVKDSIPAMSKYTDVIERIFNINQLVAQTPEHLAMVSSKIVDNRPLIRQFFDPALIGKDGMIRADLAQAATLLGRQLERAKMTIHNLGLLTDEVWEQYVKLGEVLQAYLRDTYPNHAKAVLWGSLRVKGDNIKDTIAMVEYLYKQAVSESALKKQVFEIRKLSVNLATAAKGSSLSEAIELLENPKLLRRTDIAEGMFLTYAGIDPDNLWKLVIKDDVASAVKFSEEFNDLAAGCAEQEHILKSFGRIVDKNGAYTYGTQGDIAIQLRLIPTLRETMKTVGKHMESLDDKGKEALKKAIYQYSNNRQISAVVDVLSMTPEQLQAHLWHRGLGLIRIDITEFYKNPGIKNLFYDFMANEKTLADSYIKFRLINGALYIFPDKTKLDFFKKLVAPEKLSGDFIVPRGNLPENIAEAIENLQHTIEDVSNGDSFRSTGSIITRQNMEDLRQAIPVEVRNELVDLDDIVTINPNTKLPRSLFNETHFDYSNLGDVIARKNVQAYRSTNILKDYFNTVQSLMLYADTATKTRALFFSSSSGLQVNLLFKDVPDAEILAELKNHPEYKIAMLALDKEGKEGYLVKNIPMINEDSVRYAKRMNAVVLPVQTYNMVDNITRRKEISNAFAKWLSKYIVDPTKVGFLSSLGLLMRNTIDSTWKNLISADGLTEFGPMLKHTFQTARWLHLYDSDVKAIIELGSKMAAEQGLKDTGLMTARAVKAYFEMAENAGRKEMFALIHNFIMEGPSAGITRSTLDALKKAGRLQNPDLYTKLVWGAGDGILRNHYTRLIMDTNTAIEQITRLSKYTYDILKGGHTVSEAMMGVIKTHFDYSTRSKVQMYMELVVPFMTFTWNNIKYWLDALSNHGWVAELMRDVLVPLTGFNEYNQYELQRNRSLQYAIFNGSLKLDDETNLTLKLSPSLLDAVNTLVDPIGAIGGRVIAPIRVPVSGAIAAINGEDFDWKKAAATNLPLIGPTLQRYWGLWDEEMPTYEKGTALKNIERTDQLVSGVFPSVFGSIQRNYYFSYGGTIYMTHDKSKYIDHLLNGAQAIETQEEAEAAYAEGASSGYTPYQRKVSVRKASRVYAKRYYSRARRSYPKKVYHKRVYAKKSYPKKKAYFHGTYVPRSYKADVFNRVMSAARNTQMRMPGSYRNLAYTAPVLYRKIYTGTGTDKFKSRLLPITYRNIKYKIRQDWSSVR